VEFEYEDKQRITTNNNNKCETSVWTLGENNCGDLGLDGREI
jgi:hypothetical protein